MQKIQKYLKGLADLSKRVEVKKVLDSECDLFRTDHVFSKFH